MFTEVVFCTESEPMMSSKVKGKCLYRHIMITFMEGGKFEVKLVSLRFQWLQIGSSVECKLHPGTSLKLNLVEGYWWF